MWIRKEQWRELWAHITRTNHELETVQTDMGVVKNDLKWLKWLICAVFLAVILGLIKQFLAA